jgi:uncharacterized membrane protein
MIGDGMGPDSMVPFGILGGLAWLLVLAGAALLVVWAVRAFPGARSMHVSPAPVQPATLESPLDTLSRRFALGEITADEFERGRALLRKDPPS